MGLLHWLGAKQEPTQAQIDYFNSLSVETLKKMMRKRYLAWNDLMEDFNCGGNLAAHISPRVYEAAHACNNIARRLKEIDPTFPKTWMPLPEGT